MLIDREETPCEDPERTRGTHGPLDTRSVPLRNAKDRRQLPEAGRSRGRCSSAESAESSPCRHPDLGLEPPEPGTNRHLLF